VRVWDEKSQKWIPDCYPIPLPELLDSLRGLAQLAIHIQDLTTELETFHELQIVLSSLRSLLRRLEQS